ncbi:uncharacterized protein LOC34623658 [Cyclospora cayetanensis]|uniref:Uncharacterized protein LOC34623658 n=1 Tax=Cyclospora cayetanensis TaxID=88456 RepID=A0A6P6RR30_9EIME|nr:uncharacterized protein LOC34623658 [Cyclospora cayetanensis]
MQGIPPNSSPWRAPGDLFGKAAMPAEESRGSALFQSLSTANAARAAAAPPSLFGNTPGSSASTGSTSTSTTTPFNAASAAPWGATTSLFGASSAANAGRQVAAFAGIAPSAVPKGTGGSGHILFGRGVGVAGTSSGLVGGGSTSSNNAACKSGASGGESGWSFGRSELLSNASTTGGMFGIPQGTNFANAAAGSSALDGRSTEALSPPAAVNSLSKGQGGVASSATLVDAANTSQGLSAAASSVFSNTPLRAPAFGAGADTRGVSGSTTATGILFGGPSSGSASGGPLFRGPSSGSASGGPLFGSFASGSASGGPLFGGPPAARPLPSGGLFGSAVGEAAVQEGTRQAALSHQNNKAASNRVGTAAASEGLLASSSSSGLFGGAAARGPFSAARSKGNSLPSEVSNGCPPATRSGGPFEGTAAREASSFEAGSSLFGVAAARRSNAVNGHSGGPPERSALGAALTSKGPPPGHSVGGSSLFLGSVSAAAGTGGLAATKNAGTPSEEASSGSANGGSVVAVHGRSRLCAAEGRAVPPPLPQPQGSHANPMLQADLEDGALILRVQVVQQLQQFLLDGSQASSPTGGGDGSPGGAFVGQLYGCCSHEEMLDKQQVSTASDFERLDATVPGDPEARIVNVHLAFSSFRRSDAGKPFKQSDTRPAVWCRRAVHALLTYFADADLTNGCMQQQQQQQQCLPRKEYLYPRPRPYAYIDVYNFLRDRLRACWQELTVQHVSPHRASIETLEISFRFLVLSEELLAGTPGFDAVSNHGLMQTCLDKLMQGYEATRAFRSKRDAASAAATAAAAAGPAAAGLSATDLMDLLVYSSPYEGEFWGFRLLMLLAQEASDTAVVSLLQRLPQQLQQDPSVRFALSAYKAFKALDLRRYVRLMRGGPYLLCVLLHKFLPFARARLLAALVFNRLAGGSRNPISPQRLAVLMGFDGEDEDLFLLFLKAYGIGTSVTPRGLPVCLLEQTDKSLLQDLSSYKKAKGPRAPSAFLAPPSCSSRKQLLDPDYPPEPPFAAAPPPQQQLRPSAAALSKAFYLKQQQQHAPEEPQRQHGLQGQQQQDELRKLKRLQQLRLRQQAHNKSLERPQEGKQESQHEAEQQLPQEHSTKPPLFRFAATSAADERVAAQHAASAASGSSVSTPGVQEGYGKSGEAQQLRHPQHQQTLEDSQGQQQEKPNGALFQGGVQASSSVRIGSAERVEWLPSSVDVTMATNAETRQALVAGQVPSRGPSDTQASGVAQDAAAASTPARSPPMAKLTSEVSEASPQDSAAAAGDLEALPEGIIGIRRWRRRRASRAELSKEDDSWKEKEGPHEEEHSPARTRELKQLERQQQEHQEQEQQMQMQRKNQLQRLQQPSRQQQPAQLQPRRQLSPQSQAADDLPESFLRRSSSINTREAPEEQTTPTAAARAAASLSLAKNFLVEGEIERALHALRSPEEDFLRLLQHQTEWPRQPLPEMLAAAIAAAASVLPRDTLDAILACEQQQDEDQHEMQQQLPLQYDSPPRLFFKVVFLSRRAAATEALLLRVIATAAHGVAVGSSSSSSNTAAPVLLRGCLTAAETPALPLAGHLLLWPQQALPLPRAALPVPLFCALHAVGGLAAPSAAEKSQGEVAYAVAVEEALSGAAMVLSPLPFLVSLPFADAETPVAETGLHAPAASHSSLCAVCGGSRPDTVQLPCRFSDPHTNREGAAAAQQQWTAAAAEIAHALKMLQQQQGQTDTAVVSVVFALSLPPQFFSRHADQAATDSSCHGKGSFLQYSQHQQLARPVDDEVHTACAAVRTQLFRAVSSKYPEFNLAEADVQVRCIAVVGSGGVRRKSNDGCSNSTSSCYCMQDVLPFARGLLQCLSLDPWEALRRGPLMESLVRQRPMQLQRQQLLLSTWIRTWNQALNAATRAAAARARESFKGLLVAELQQEGDVLLAEAPEQLFDGPAALQVAQVAADAALCMEAFQAAAAAAAGFINRCSSRLWQLPPAEWLLALEMRLLHGTQQLQQHALSLADAEFAGCFPSVDCDIVYELARPLLQRHHENIQQQRQILPFLRRVYSKAAALSQLVDLATVADACRSAEQHPTQMQDKYHSLQTVYAAALDTARRNAATVIAAVGSEPMVFPFSVWHRFAGPAFLPWSQLSMPPSLAALEETLRKYNDSVQRQKKNRPEREDEENDEEASVVDCKEQQQHCVKRQCPQPSDEEPRQLRRRLCCRNLTLLDECMRFAAEEAQSTKALLDRLRL